MRLSDREARRKDEGWREMHRIDKTLIVLDRSEVEQMKCAVAKRDGAAALRLVKDIVARKVELALKKRCK